MRDGTLQLSVCCMAGDAVWPHVHAIMNERGCPLQSLRALSDLPERVICGKGFQGVAVAGACHGTCAAAL